MKSTPQYEVARASRGWLWLVRLVAVAFRRGMHSMHADARPVRDNINININKGSTHTHNTHRQAGRLQHQPA